ncbi:LamB/YcsF family protein [Actibacterium atlanticum]|uniref:LamB/YcsF family protein n=1 Tax=Actibacterium atlanticum TaxID=1461693 RepID=A0A058ZKM3_9RHOB|nr:5-oxoprolinase subunit PxpA [Actibacterium atlanticum]KCV81745.1 LamB/YcsF family protein [Actibacterium atlanticum]
MQSSVDLNADMGEGIGDDSALLRIVSSANVACGFHAGGPDVMAATMAAAVAQGVAIGAHPGFDDRANFGRSRMALTQDQLRHLITYQLGAAQAMARAAGGQVAHLKLHGALANMAAEDAQIARACYQAALELQPDLTLTVIAATMQQQVATELGANYAAEIFADRAYNPDATLVDRSLPGAVIHDPDEAAERVVQMLRTGAVIAQDGSHIPTRIDTICLHGDGTTALQTAQQIRHHLERADITIRPPAV